MVTHYVGSHIDITERKAAEEEIQYLAFYDPLTRLPNRRLLLDRLKQALVSSARSGREGALLFIDLDNFKNLNDTLGHDIGDLLLQQVTQRLEACIRKGDTVARLGGDEFVVMLLDLSDQTHRCRGADRRSSARRYAPPSASLTSWIRMHIAALPASASPCSATTSSRRTN